MKLILFIALLLPFAWGCKKKTAESNDNSSSYANSFTCTVNGQSWVAQTPSNPNGPTAIEAYYYPDYDELDIFATQKDKLSDPSVYQTIFLRILHPYNPAENSRIQIGNGNLFGFSDLVSSDCDVYYYDSLYNCTCNISLWDPVKCIAEGNFSITLRNPDCPDSIMTITNGQFSTYYQ